MKLRLKSTFLIFFLTIGLFACKNTSGEIQKSQHPVFWVPTHAWSFATELIISNNPRITANRRVLKKGDELWIKYDIFVFGSKIPIFSEYQILVQNLKIKKQWFRFYFTTMGEDTFFNEDTSNQFSVEYSIKLDKLTKKPSIIVFHVMKAEKILMSVSYVAS